MTHDEFAAWLEEKYDGLVRQVNGGNDGWAREALQVVVTRLLEDSTPLRGVHIGDGLEPWLKARMNGEILNIKRAARLTEKGSERFGHTLKALGEDAYLDTATLNEAKRKQRYEKKRKAARRAKRLAAKGLTTPSGQYGLESVIQWDGPMPGSVRWLFQTLRDDKLFLKAYYGSKGESVKATTDRTHHFGEPGNYYTEFGQGVAL